MARRLLLLTVLGLTVLPAAAHGTELIAVEPARVYADQHGKRVAWSSFDRRARVHHLVTREAGEVVVTRAPESAHPFRLDVGPGPDGEPVAVYPRCDDDAECDLYLYDFARRRERKLRRLSTPEASESLPSVWRSRIAFSRRAAGVSTMYVSRLDGRGSRPLPGGRQTAPAGPLAIELRGRRTTFVWSRRGDDGLTETTLWLERRGRIRMLDRTKSSRRRAASFVTPEIRGRSVFYARTLTGRRRGNQLRRVDVRSRRVRYVPAPFRGLVAAVWAGDRFLLSRAREPETEDPENECRPPGSDPADSICRLLLGDPVRRWRPLGSGSR